MRVVAALSALVALAQARAVGVRVPSVIRPGDTINVVVKSENYIQKVQEIGFSLGYFNVQIPDNVGTHFASVCLGDALSDQTGDFNVSVKVPDTIPLGASFVTAAISQIYGATGSPAVMLYRTGVTFGEATSDEYNDTYFVSNINTSS